MVAVLGAILPGETPGFAHWALIAGTVGLLVGLLLLGADSELRAGAAPWIFVGTGAWVIAGFALALLLPPEDPEAPRLLLGLPLRAAILLYGVGLGPALVLPWVYARLFERDTLRDSDLEELRAMVRSGPAAGSAVDADPGSRT